MSLYQVMGSRGFKAAMLGVLILLFLIPVGMIRGIIYERSRRAAEAEEGIMHSWGDQFLILGPALKIPGRKFERLRTRTEGGEEKVEIRESPLVLWAAPEELSVSAELGTEVKKRGIFSVPLFSGTAKFSGHFDSEKILRELGENQELFLDRAEMVISLASQRGIREIEKAEWNGGEVYFLPGNQGFSPGSSGPGGKESGGGIHGAVRVPREGKNRFEVVMGLQGGKSLRMVPLGEDSFFSVKADWPAPSFQGSFLPVSRTLDEKGFEAQWKISRLSRSVPPVWFQEEAGTGPRFSSSLFWINFFKPLDHYDVNTRAVKYGILFIIIPFLSLFLFEIFLRRDIHPVQYLLSGIGNVIFYLLLLSFSEHIPFTPAYGISALAVSAMTGLYAFSILGSWRQSWPMALVMILGYTFLYFTLQSEDWALLTGSLGAFAVTALVMFLTRKLDWYGRPQPRPGIPPEDTTTDTFHDAAAGFILEEGADHGNSQDP